MKKLRNIILVFAAVIGMGLAVPTGVYAAGSVISEACDGDTESRICKDQTADPNALIKNIVNVLLFVVGAISVLVIIVGGLIYITSSGDSGRITMAKHTIMYAVVGVVISFLAYAIVNFVFDNFGK